ncbi:MAG: O-antigen ligase family protein [Acidobacteriota bacterium]|nr:O-antigen ligase family protein [Acidobacteriota bacterium]
MSGLSKPELWPPGAGLPAARALAIACGIGIWSAALALAPGAAAKLALIIPILFFGLGWWCAMRPHRWLVLFFPCLLLTPPIPAPVGDAGLHLAPALALIGVLVGILRLPDWNPRLSALALAFGLFVGVLLVSSGLGALYSGGDVGLGSLLRVALFSIAVYVFFYVSAGPAERMRNPLSFARVLFLIGCAAALFACADFYFQFPAPAGFEEQFVWLDEGVLRRAQGLFYDASTLGNFCAFFLVMIAVALCRPRQDSPCSRPLLVAGGAIFTVALMLSYSRGSVVNVAVALGTLAILRRRKILTPLLLAGLVLGVVALAVQAALPSFSISYWDRIANSFQYFWYSPNGVLSGRPQHWSALAGFLLGQPWHAVLGVGYKTLPYSSFAGEPIVADNTYLSLLVETGIAGLAAFVILNLAILKYSLRAARSAGLSAGFFGEWMFCFWAGEMVQMLSGDLITYWRVLPVYFWVLGTAVREAQRKP